MEQKYLKLLNYLNSQNEPKKIKEIANKLCISSRSVKNYTDDINNIYNKKIIISSRNGYELNRNIPTEVLFSNIELDNIPQTFEERSYYIINKMLLDHTLNLDLFDLCDELYISYSSVKNIISKMNEKFYVYHVKFICKHDFLYIEGEEKNIRKLISFVVNESNHNSYIDFLQVQNYFPNYDIDSLRSIIYSTFRKHNFYLNDFTSINYIIHLLIIIDRKKIGKSLNEQVIYNGETDKNTKDLIFDLISKLEDTFHIQFNEFERNDITIFTNTIASYSISATKKELEKLVDQDIIALTYDYINEINNFYHIDLKSDIFLTPFCLHLKNLIFRAKNNHYISNPFVESIRLNNPVIFDVATYISINLTKKYHINITEDEIAFLAMHIGAEIERQQCDSSKLSVALICPLYLGLNSKIYNDLLIKFGTMITIEKNVTSESELNGDDFDIIFTTYSLQGKHKADIITIDPFKLNSQRQIIEDLIINKQKKVKNELSRVNIHNYFHEDLFIVNSKLDTKDEIISYFCNLLVEKEFVNHDFLDSIYQRENAATTAFGKIAIPHAMKMNANKTCISVAISKNGILWENEKVFVVLLIAINKTDSVIFRYLYEQLIESFTDEKFTVDVLHCQTFHDFKKLLLSYFNF